MNQIKHAVKIVELKYLKDEGWRVLWLFDHNSCHAAMRENASKINGEPWW